MSAAVTITLGKIMATKIGSVDPSKFADEVFDLYSIPAFDKGQPDIVEGAKIGSAKQIVKSGDVLLSKIVPHIRRSWIVGEDRGRRLIASGEWIVFRGDCIYPGYLRHVLVGDPFHIQFMSTVSGVGGSLLRARPTHVANIAINLPSLPEQRRIAAALDKAEELRAKRRSTLALLDEYNQSIFIEMFGDTVTNPKGWSETISLGEVADIVSGVTKNGKLNGKVTREIPYLAVVNVQDKSLNLSVVKSIEATEAEINRYRLQKGDLLLTEGGDPDKLGRGTLWNEELPECIHQNHIFRVRLTTDKIHPFFLNWLVGSQRGKKYFLRSAKQTTGIASINMTQLRGFPLLLPPVALQHEFARRIAAVEILKASHRASLAELDALFAALQYRAFRGEL
ncbi:MAG: restriction endonuclease subunit S [Desulfuromonadales bacterium]|nr:restriction endonuclease subunit S [Desulfuromonadales bacterium]